MRQFASGCDVDDERTLRIRDGEKSDGNRILNPHNDLDENAFANSSAFDQPASYSCLLALE